MSYRSDSFLFGNNLVGGDRKQFTEDVLREVEKRIDEFIDLLWNCTDDDVRATGAKFAGTNTTGGVINGGAPILEDMNAASFKEALTGLLKKKNFTIGSAARGGAPAPAANSEALLKTEAKEQVKFLFHVKDILAKAQGSYMGEDLKADIGDSVETARERIKQDVEDAFGPGNRQLAYRVSSAMKLLLKDFGDAPAGMASTNAVLSRLQAQEDKIAQAIAQLAAAISHKNSRAAAMPVAAAAGGSHHSSSRRGINRL